MRDRKEKDLERLYDLLKRSKSINFRCNSVIFLSYLKEMYPSNKHIMKLNRRIKFQSIMHIGKIIGNTTSLLIDNKKFVKENKGFNTLIPNSGLSYCNINKLVIPFDELYQILLSFSKSLDNDFYLFVKKLIDDKKILIRIKTNKKMFGLDSDISTGMGYNLSIENGLYFIYLNRFNSISDLLVLVHEIGHLYYCYINKINSFDKKTRNDDIKEEIPSRIMERLLVNYLYNYNNSYAIITEKELNNNIIRDETKNNKYTKMKYTLGDFASYIFKDYINKEISLDNFMRYIYSSCYHEILDNANKGFNKRM